MKLELMKYLENGKIETCEPEQAVYRKQENGVAPMYRDTVCELNGDKMECTRVFYVGKQPFIVTSVFNTDSNVTATDKMLSYIDSELKKEAHSA